jgi:hypothetical protein
MTRIVFIGSLLAFSSVAEVNHAYAQSQTRQECDNTASRCLGTCADKYKPKDDSEYNRCVVNCDSERNRCRINAPDLPKR